MTHWLPNKKTEVVLAIDDISKHYSNSANVIEHASLAVNVGESVALMGPSGCGKSTLLNILGLMDKPSSGRYQLNGEEVDFTSPAQLQRMRKDHIGFIFQNYCLIENLSILDNVALPLLYKNTPRAEAYRLALASLDKVGIAVKAPALPNTLSGGEQQRAGIARALSACPRVLLADEPTGNLDSTTAGEIFGLLLSIAAENDTAVIVVTHDRVIASRCSSRYRMENKVLHVAT